MTITTQITQGELERQAELCLLSQPYTIFLADNSSAALTGNDTSTDWYSNVVVDAAYADVSGTIAAGSWNGTSLRFEMPAVTATFTADAGGTGFTYDSVCVIVGYGPDYLHSIITESPSISLAPGQSKTYIITFAQDD